MALLERIADMLNQVVLELEVYAMKFSAATLPTLTTSNSLKQRFCMLSLPLILFKKGSPWWSALSPLL